MEHARIGGRKHEERSRNAIARNTGGAGSVPDSRRLSDLWSLVLVLASDNTR